MTEQQRAQSIAQLVREKEAAEHRVKELEDKLEAAKSLSIALSRFLFVFDQEGS